MGKKRNAYKILIEKNLKGRGNSEDLGVDRWLILELDVREIDWEAVGWIHLAQNRDKWWALVDTVMKSRVP
jgi:hypothetical protein